MTSLVNKEAFEYLWKHNKKTLHDKEDGKKELPNKENIFHMRERERVPEEDMLFKPKSTFKNQKKVVPLRRVPPSTLSFFSLRV